MNLKVLSGVAVLLVAAGAAWWVWSVRAPLPQAAPEPEAHILAGAATSAGGYQYTEEGAHYRAELLYPAKTPLADPVADHAARIVMETALRDQLEDFKTTVSDLTPDIMPSLEGRKLLLAAGYDEYTAPGTVSYVYTVSSDTGGAHPNGYYMTFVFDRQGRDVFLSDVLGRNFNWPDELSLAVSSEVVRQVRERLGESDVTGVVDPKGLSPDVINFRNWYLAGDSLVILIPPYQAAAYALGSFEVRVPLSSIDR